MLRISKFDSKFEFDNCPAPTLFEDKSSNRAFAMLANEAIGFKISWASDMIVPDIKVLGGYIYCIGIDQKFCILDAINGELYVDLDLSYLYLQTYVNSNYAFVITEMEVLKFGKLSFELLEKYDFPDLIESAEFAETTAIIRCFGGTCIEIAL